MGISCMRQTASAWLLDPFSNSSPSDRVGMTTRWVISQPCATLRAIGYQVGDYNFGDLKPAPHPCCSGNVGELNC